MRNKMKTHNISRMTLIEVMIAMVILVIIMGFLTMMISKVQLVTRSSTRRADIYNQQRLFFDIMARDLESIVVADLESATGDRTESIDCIFISDSGFAFITTSGIGYTDTDSSLFLEVKYEFNSTTGEIIRHYTAQRHGADWNYKTVNQFYQTMGDESVLLEGVRNFSVKAYDLQGNEIASTYYDSWVLPAYVEINITVVPPELHDDTSSAENQYRYSFSKMIYFPNGELE